MKPHSLTRIMDYPVGFARHFARLVWLLLHEPGNIDEQKASLRAVVAASRQGPVRINAGSEGIRANDLPLVALPEVSALWERMAEEQVAAIDADTSAAAADLLNAARLLADTNTDGPRMAPIGTVRFLTPLPEIVQVDGDPNSLLAEGESNESFENLPPPPAPAPMPSPTAPMTPPNVVPPLTSAEPRGFTQGLFEHFAAAPTSVPDYEALLAQLDSAKSAGRLMGVLDRLARMAEEAERSGQRRVASEILHRIIRREGETPGSDSKRAFVGTVRRLSRPGLLRAVAEELVRTPERREEHLAVLTRTGEDGADALIEQLAAAPDRSERRILFDALIELRAGVPTLVHMLGDPRWFVARNAAALLGEMRARDAEKALAEQLHHDDERVRHAATIALMRLGTARSIPAIEQALGDGAPQIRIQAAAALAELKPAGAGASLLRALDAERDDEVRASFLHALGRLGTPDAVEHLVVAAQPERGLFRRKTTALRVAAIRALAGARTEPALTALRELKQDREPEIRDAASEALDRSRETQPRAEPTGW